MKTTTRRNLIALASAMALVACRQTTTSDLDTAVNSSYGALQEADEQADFGDEEIASEPDLGPSEDSAVTDATADGSSEVQTSEGDTVNPARKLRIAVLWGQLRPRPNATVATDWSGTVSIENGALRVLRTLRFEQGDAVTLPRTDIRTVAMVSSTQVSADGLLLEVIVHPSLVTNAAASAPVLHFDTAAYSDTLTLRPGMRLERVVPVGDAGNAVAYHIFRPSQGGCQEGLMVGRYTAAEETEDGRVLGEIKGKYLSFDGSVGGKVKGVWGERHNGKQVFFGKVIGRDGEFKGLLAGRYADGKLGGRFLGKGKIVNGTLRGMYREAKAADGSGFFMGRWSLNCQELAVEGQTEASDEANAPVDAAQPE